MDAFRHEGERTVREDVPSNKMGRLSEFIESRRKIVVHEEIYDCRACRSVPSASLKQTLFLLLLPLLLTLPLAAFNVVIVVVFVADDVAAAIVAIVVVV